MNEITKVDQFKAVLNSQTIRAQIKNSLKERSGQFLSSMVDLYSTDSALQKCDPQEVAMECVKAAVLDLPIVKSLGLAYVVPYKNKPTFTVGYKGYIQLAQRSGQYRCINADVVREGELKGQDKLTGMIDLSGEKISDNIVGYFAYFSLLNGFEKVLYMSKAEVENWANRYSPSAGSSYSPWKTDFDKMAIKTCLRRLLKTYGILSTEMQQALDMDGPEDKKVNANSVPVQSQTITVDSDTGEVIEDELP